MSTQTSSHLVHPPCEKLVLVKCVSDRKLVLVEVINSLNRLVPVYFAIPCGSKSSTDACYHTSYQPADIGHNKVYNCSHGKSESAGRCF